MCGLSGIISKKDHNQSYLNHKLLKMTELISHRGPDQAGYLKHENVYLSHVRLSVMDPRNLGRQPMSNDNRYAIIFNGEIYNFLEIRNNLIKKGYRFYTNTDTEVALNAYKEWGVKCFKMFNGDWVISLLDKLKNKLILAKDQIGSLPIYTYEDSGIIAFSSEIKGLNVIKNLEFNKNYLGINGVTINGFHGTKFNNIRQVKPGTYLEVDLKLNEMKEVNWFNPLENLINIHPSYKNNQIEFFERLYNATKLRLNADIKIGTSLSGGLDSSIIFSILNLIEHNEDLDKKVELNPTIVNYDGNLTYNEAVQLADLHDRKYNIFNSKMQFDFDSLSILLSQLEIPEEYNKQLDLYKEQKKLGIHVSIDGHGADEFSGMISDIPQLSLEYYNNLVDLNIINNDFKNNHNIKLVDKFFDNFSHKKNKASFKLSNLMSFENYFRSYVEDDPKQIQEENFIIAKYLDDLEDFSIDFQYIFFKTHGGFLQYFTNKWNKAGMASSVEVRSPFLDKNVYLYLLSIPIEKKLKNGKIKSILKDSFKNQLPDYILNQNFKQGLPKENYNTKEDLKNIISEILSQKDFNENCWDSNKIKIDFKRGKNLNLIWDICKFYLMKEGFKNRTKNLSKPEEYLTQVKNLSKI